MFHFEHFSSAPFLSGDSFRSICNHAYDEFSDVEPSAVRPGEVIFVKNNFLHDFFKYIHPHIKSPYILLNHSDDTEVDESYIKYIDKNVIHWFGLNINVQHPKMTPIPIGIENIGYRNKADLSYFLDSRYRKSERKERILVAFNIQNVHPERVEAFEKATMSPFVDVHPLKKTQQEYIETVSQYTYIVSPRGAGIDCHRTWEALYLGVRPIVKHSVNTAYFESIGLPIEVVNSWNDIDNMFQSKKLESEKTNTTQHPALYIDYWVQEIQEKRKGYFATLA